MQVPSGTDPPGYTTGELRVARYDGTQLVRLPAAVEPQRAGAAADPTASPRAHHRLRSAGATPQVTMDATGNGILAWQEPDDALIDRIWARRLFGTNTGIATQVSPATWKDVPLRAPVDQFSLDSAGFGQGAIAYRQQPAADGPLVGTRIMLTTIPETSAPNAAAFGAPRIVDGAGDAPAGRPGRPRSPSTASVTPRPSSASPSAVLPSADDRTVRARAPRRRRTSIGGTPEVDIGASGAAVAAWQVRRGRRRRGGDRAPRRTACRSARRWPRPRAASSPGFALAGSGLGDGLLGWMQGGQIAAVVVDAPPDPFAANAPTTYVRTPPADPLGHARARDRRRHLRGDDRRRHRRGEPQDDLARAAQARLSTTACTCCRWSPPTRAGRRRRAGPPQGRPHQAARARPALPQPPGPGDGLRPTSGVDNTSVRVSWGDGKRSSGPSHRRRTATARAARSDHRLVPATRRAQPRQLQKKVSP